jgi:hypothetical protein
VRILSAKLNVKRYLAEMAFPTLSIVELVRGRISMFTAAVVHIRIEDSSLAGCRGYLVWVVILRLVHSHIGPLSFTSSARLRQGALSSLHLYLVS